jgi:predicted porin
MNSVFKSTGYNIRPANTLAYYTPSFSGFTASVSYSLGEDKTATTDAGSVTSFAANYAAGPLLAYVAYQTEKLTAPTAASVGSVNTTGVTVVSALALPTDSTDYTRIGAAYDFGMAKPMMTYGKKSLGTGSTDEYQLGVDVPFGATTLSASWATSQDNAALGDSKRTGFGLGAKYALSKRTFVYGGYESDTTTKPATLDAKHNNLLVGMQHRF